MPDPTDAETVDLVAILSGMRESLEAKTNQLVEGQRRLFDSAAAMESRIQALELRGSEPRRQSQSGSEEPPPTESIVSPSPSLQDIAVVRIIAKPQRAALPVTRWFTFTTVLAFAVNIPQVSAWIPDETRQLHDEMIPRLKDIAGLPLLFFTVENNDRKDRYNKRDGAVWTHILRWVIANVITSAKEELFGNSEPPLFLKKLGDPSETLRKVRRCLKHWRIFSKVTDSYLDLDDDSPASSVPLKRRRVHGTTVIDRALEHSPQSRNLQKDTIQGVKSALQVFLTGNRREAKLYLYSHLLYLVERISTIGTADEARQQGFFFEINSPAPSEILPDSIAGTSWEIADAHQDDFYKASCPSDGLNDNLVLALSERFPFLTVVAHWRRNVQRAANDLNTDHPHYTVPELQYSCSRKISLHLIARGLLREFVHQPDHGKVMRSSRYSLKCIHIFAIGLLALIKECMQLPLNSVEVAAKGSLQARPRFKDQSFVSAFVHGTTVPPLEDRSAEPDARPSQSSTTPTQLADRDSSPVTLPFPEASHLRALAGKKEGDTDETAQLQLARFKMFNISWTDYLDSLRSETAQATSHYLAPSAREARNASPTRGSTDDYSDSFDHLSSGPGNESEIQAKLDAIH